MRYLFIAGLAVSAVAASAAEPADPALVPTCPGWGYLPYAYPAFGSCPCGEDGCFPPQPYYACCGDGDPAYKQAFWRRWLRAHFCGGSMLEGVPCHCVYPPSRVTAMPLAPIPATVPSQPGATAPEEDVTEPPLEAFEPPPAEGPSPPAPKAIGLDAVTDSP